EDQRRRPAGPGGAHRRDDRAAHPRRDHAAREEAGGRAARRRAGAGVIRRVRAELALFASKLSPGGILLFTASGLFLWAYEYGGSAHFFTHVIARRFLPDLLPRNIEAGSYLYWFASA